MGWPVCWPPDAGSPGRLAAWRLAVDGDLANGPVRLNSALAHFMGALDSRLRDRHAVFEYTSDPNCILRGAIGFLDCDLSLSDGTGADAGDRLIDLHLWSEQVPAMPQSGATVGWARRMHAGMVISLQELARFLSGRPDLDDITVVRATTAFAGRRRNDQNIRLMRGYGFEPATAAPAATLHQRGHRLAENFLITLLVLTHNPPALKSDTLLRDHVPLFMSRHLLKRRYIASS